MAKYVVGEDDPNRCQGMMSQGQCTMEALPGQSFCKMHIGGAALVSQKKEEIRNLRLGQWQQRVGEIATNPQIKSLREEIGILRLTLEEVMNMCQNTAELIANSNKITDLVLKIDKLVTSCHQLEKSSGMLLDKSAALVLASQFIEIISRHCKDAEAMTKISEEMISALDSLDTTITAK